MSTGLHLCIHWKTSLSDSALKYLYKLCCTATPAPHDHMELGTHSEFLGAMGRNEMLSMFFVHDGGDTSKWRLKGHAADKFWEWMASWSVMMRTPADLGFPDDRYNLPELRIHEHIVETAIPKGHLFQSSAATLQEQREARRDTIQPRIAKMLEVLDLSRPAAIFCNLNDESEAAADALAVHGGAEITGSQSADVKELRLRQFATGEYTKIVSKPRICGRGLNWQFCRQICCLGMSHSWADFFQLVSRCLRFGQDQPVDVHIVVSDRDDAIMANIKRKQQAADAMAEGMVKAMSKYTIGQLGSVGAERMTG